ncbi:uncharacterized protein Dyak_GE28816 [Drosophila yakuba]|uniref:Uncharacterized protein n=1 Tax=Drosophila yakuba TaxID=7245 RepID=A0A0R1E5X0_DROYA|nr:uncharacterized protein Dyak_GE28816 [Drosophila yakuba]
MAQSFRTNNRCSSQTATMAKSLAKYFTFTPQPQESGLETPGPIRPTDFDWGKVLLFAYCN